MFFGAPHRELFGMMQPGADTGGHRSAVLLCSPFGLEAIRAHRTYRVLSERLARAGHWVLRFDYYGSGDSDGEDRDVSLAGMCDDIETASRTLQSAAPAGLPLTWIGLGLGATAAWLAASRAARPPSQLLLWEPILDGRAYLKTLRHRHAELIGPNGVPATRRPADAAKEIEVLGFAISPILRGEIQSLGATTLPTLPATTRATLVAQPDDALAKSLVLNAGGAAQLELVEQGHTVDWMSETADAGTIVPGAAILKLAALVRRST